MQEQWKELYSAIIQKRPMLSAHYLINFALSAKAFRMSRISFLSVCSSYPLKFEVGIQIFVVKMTINRGHFVKYTFFKPT